jgi:hypothetical protein
VLDYGTEREARMRKTRHIYREYSGISSGMPVLSFAALATGLGYSHRLLREPDRAELQLS